MDPTTLTLRAWYATFESVFLNGSQVRTFLEYRTTLNRWEALTSNPMLAAIDTPVLAGFQSAILTGGGSRPTANKHLRHVQHLLNKAAQPGPKNRNALGLLTHAAWTKPLKCLKPLPPYLTPRQLNTLYQACEHAMRPNAGVSPEAWWQALIVLTYNLALRRGAVLGLKWSNIDLQAALLRVPAEIDKRGVERLKPLNSTCVRHLLRIRENVQHVFTWPHGERGWYQQWRLLAGKVCEEKNSTMVQTSFNFAAASGEPAGPEDIGLVVRYPQPVAKAVPHFHDLKRTSATVWAGHASPWAVRYMLDHGPGDVTGLYVDPTNELREKCETLPQPSCFLGGEHLVSNNTFPSGF